jgi:polyhydroxyalkanoate synthesis regulator protein
MHSPRNSNQPILVKRYARARLYDTVGLRYVTTDTIRDWLAGGIAVSVIDAESGEDVTRVLLA